MDGKALHTFVRSFFRFAGSWKFMYVLVLDCLLLLHLQAQILLWFRQHKPSLLLTLCLLSYFLQTRRKFFARPLYGSQRQLKFHPAPTFANHVTISIGFLSDSFVIPPTMKLNNALAVRSFLFVLPVFEFAKHSARVSECRSKEADCSSKQTSNKQIKQHTKKKVQEIVKCTSVSSNGNILDKQRL